MRGNSASAKRLGELITRIDTMQQAIIARVKPGKPYEDLHDDCHRLLADVLVETGIGKGSAA